MNIYWGSTSNTKPFEKWASKENASCTAIDLKIFTMNMLILEILHTAFYYLFWVKSQGFGLDGFLQAEQNWQDDLLDHIHRSYTF